MVRIPVANDRRVDSWRAQTTMNYNLRKESFLGTETKINFIVTIEVANSTDILYFGDKPLYVDDHYYEPRMKIPEIKNQLSDLLDASLELSEVEFSIDNSDGAYNSYLVGGADYSSFIGSYVKIYYGIGSNLADGYIKIFSGQVHQEGALTRDVKSLKFRARDLLSIYVGVKILPEIILTDIGVTPIDVKLQENKTWPFVLGDWGVDRYDSATTFPDTNGGNDNNARDVGVFEGIVGTYLGLYDFTGAGWVGENGVNFTGELHVVAVCNTCVSCHHLELIIDTDNTLAKARPHCYVVQGDVPYSIGDTMYDYMDVGDGTKHYYIFDDLWRSAVATNSIEYSSGDRFIFQTYAADIGGNKSNDHPVVAAQTLLKTYANLPDESFDGFSWSTYSDTGNGFRWYYTSDDKTLIQIALSMLKQSRVDLFLTKDETLKLCSLQTYYLPTPSLCRQIEDLDMDEDSVAIELLRKEFMNYAQGKFSWLPYDNNTVDSTAVLHNYNSINKSSLFTGKLIDMPNHSSSVVVAEHVTEIVRLFSAGLEMIEMKLSWRHIDLEPGEFVTVTFTPGFNVFVNAPMQVRSIAIDPESSFVTIKCLGLANYAWTAYEPSNVARLLSTSSQEIN